MNITDRSSARGLRTLILSGGAAALLTVLLIAYVDRPFATWSHAVLRRPAWAVELTHIAHVLMVLSVPGVLVCLLIRPFRPWGPVARTVLAASVATLLALVAGRMLKYAGGRTWPETWVANNPSWIGNGVFGFQPFHGGRGYESFPSGHMMVTMPSATVLWHRVREMRAVAVLLPLAVMVGLLAADYHWASDCVAGAWIGGAFGALGLRLFPLPQPPVPVS